VEHKVEPVRDTGELGGRFRIADIAADEFRAAITHEGLAFCTVPSVRDDAQV
jgi:hypothetical protein